MSVFHAGQKIKKVRGRYLGTTAIVTRVTDWFTYVRADRQMTNRAGDVFAPYEEWFLADESEWEPILPEGLESNEHIDALYEPSPEVVTQ